MIPIGSITAKLNKKAEVYRKTWSMRFDTWDTSIRNHSIYRKTNAVYLSTNSDTTILLIPLELVGYVCGVTEMIEKVVSDNINKMRQKKENNVHGEADITADGINDKITPTTHDKFMADENDNS